MPRFPQLIACIACCFPGLPVDLLLNRTLLATLVPHLTLLCNTFPPDQGAAPARLLALAKFLQKEGYRVRVLTSMPHYPKARVHTAYRGKSYLKETIEGVEVHRFWIYAAFNRSALQRIFSFISLNVSLLWYGRSLLLDHATDGFLVQSPPIGLAWLVHRLAKFHRKPYYLNLSDLWPEAVEALGRSWFLKLPIWFARREMHQVYRAATFLFVQSAETQAILTRQYGHKVGLLRTGFDTKAFHDHYQPIPGSPARTIVYFGVLGIAHDVVRIFQAIPYAQFDLHWQIVGSGSEYTLLEKLAGEQEQLTIRPFVAHEELVPILYSAQVVLVCQGTRLVGTLPSKLYDAMAAGRPILYIGAGEGAEIVQTAQCGWVCSASDISQIAYYLQLIQDADLAELEQMGRHAFKYAWTHFGRNKQIASAWHTMMQTTALKNIK